MRKSKWYFGKENPIRSPKRIRVAIKRTNWKRVQNLDWRSNKKNNIWRKWIKRVDSFWMQTENRHYGPESEIKWRDNKNIKQWAN